MNKSRAPFRAFLEDSPHFLNQITLSFPLMNVLTADYSLRGVVCMYGRTAIAPSPVPRREGGEEPGTPRLGSGRVHVQLRGAGAVPHAVPALRARPRGVGEQRWPIRCFAVA